jgi:D-alanyl-lipoteichoic acid acyltransferase DltB (MBOAT superfamily)
MYHLLYQSATLHSVFMGLVLFSKKTVITTLNSVNQLILVMVKCGVLFEVRTEFLNNM